MSGPNPPMRREMTQYRGQLKPLPANEIDIATVNSRIDECNRKFGDSMRELNDRVERQRDRLNTMEPNVVRLMTDVSAIRTIPVVSHMGVSNGISESDLEAIRVRLRGQEDEMQRLGRLVRTQQDNIDVLQRNLQEHIRSTTQFTSNFDNRVQDTVHMATDHRLGEIARIQFPSMMMTHMFAQFQPQITQFRIPEFRQIRPVDAILRDAIDQFRIQPALVAAPQRRIAQDPHTRALQDVVLQSDDDDFAT
jgi:hypothetical protein